MFASLRRRLPRIGRFPRLCTVGICLLLAAQSALTGRRASAAPPGSVAVIVAARTLPAGHALGRGDVRAARWPAALRPAAARGDLREVIGRRLAGAIGAGEAVTSRRLLGGDLTAGLPPDLVAAPVALADAHVADLVRPGEHVDLLATRRAADEFDPSTATGPVTTLASSAVALAVFTQQEDGAAAELVLAVPRATAVAIARDSSTHVFTVVLAPP